ncbi:uncharacterized protein F5891DRAFT_977854 [Suillus fuscotomentosus]|uniref:Helitron helicase-like domain-containing protein n=1 Tax=Suillus fuscotomentosus TaxID=1912939 RepID=A0AAD4EBK6_9AGAM|nr:uncharacterized protein F5891DRAFT_977854 [Suillus fuscotomentosus]KAG1903264.1 hypothetical protein F5891DRAFT_977854 [Suillus fuscotomentosus]
MYDLMLVSRARASQIIHFYAHKPSGHLVPEESSQRYNQGNVAIRPQDSVELRNMLPPSEDELCNAMCMIFAGYQEKPSCATVKQMHPVLVTKSVVKTLIEFLVANNPWYQQCSVLYSQENMDALFEDIDGDADTGIPKALQICHLSKDDSIDQFLPLESHNPSISDSIDPGDITMEAIGFTKGDHSAMSQEKMKLHALAHVLDHNKFILSKAGSSFVSDSDPGLMSFLFPHLDPWDISGFNHSGHMRPQHITIEAQVKNLLHQENSLFVRDPNFAFICWNMIQKKEVSTNTNFRIGASLQHTLAEELRDVGPSLMSLVEKWMCSVNAKPSTTQEKKAAKLLHCLHASARLLKGSAGYKLCHHNERCSLMKKFSTPALFVTVNPHDLTNSMIPILLEMGLEEWSLMTLFERAKIVVGHPNAAAIAFDLQIQAFIDIINMAQAFSDIAKHIMAW